MRGILISLFVALTLFSGVAVSDDISVIYKETVGIDHRYDFKVRIFRLCIDGLEFVQTFAVCPLKGSVSSHLRQVYEPIGNEGAEAPKTCKHK